LTDYPREDWFRLLTDLQRAQVSHAQVAAILGCSVATVIGWKQGSEPRHSTGQALKALHAQHCCVAVSIMEDMR